MRIAVTSKGKDMDADVDPRFGRARYLIVVDTESGAFEAIDNSAGVDATQGAGIQAGRAVAGSGAGALITGNCGPKAFSVLKSAGIEIYTGAVGTVRDALKAYDAGNLPLAAAPNVQGHW